MSDVSSRRRRNRAALVAAPVVAFLSAFFVIPLLVVLSLAFVAFDPSTLTGTGVTLEHVSRFIGDDFYQLALGRTFGIAIATTALAVLVGYPVAYHLYTLRSARLRAVLVLIVLLPVMVSFVVTAFSWAVILGGNGLVNQALIGMGLTGRPLRILSTNTGVVIVLAYTFVPFMIMNIYASLETIDPALSRSASILGAAPGRVFRHIILPMSLPGVLSGSLLVFSLALGAFVTPIIIGGSQVKTIPVLIFNFATGVYDWPGAAALAVLFLVASVVATWLFARAFQRQFLAWLAPG